MASCIGGTNIKNNIYKLKKAHIIIGTTGRIEHMIKLKYEMLGKLVRANIHLNDWAPGHMIQYEKDEEWFNWTNWKTNQGLMFDESSLHIGMNGGTTHKYTLQLSGFLEGS